MTDQTDTTLRMATGRVEGEDPYTVVRRAGRPDFDERVRRRVFEAVKTSRPRSSHGARVASLALSAVSLLGVLVVAGALFLTPGHRRPVHQRPTTSAAPPVPRGQFYALARPRTSADHLPSRVVAAVTHRGVQPRIDAARTALVESRSGVRMWLAPASHRSLCVVTSDLAGGGSGGETLVCLPHDAAIRGLVLKQSATELTAVFPSGTSALRVAFANGNTAILHEDVNGLVTRRFPTLAVSVTYTTARGQRVILRLAPA